MDWISRLKCSVVMTLPVVCLERNYGGEGWGGGYDTQVEVVEIECLVSITRWETNWQLMLVMYFREKLRYRLINLKIVGPTS
jgi:hypothetical protein